MKSFKGKYSKGGEGDRFRKYREKSFRKTGKNLRLYDLYTIFVPNYRRFKGWWD